MPPPHTPPLHLLVMAAGLGTRARRADAAPPKQFRQVGGASLALWGVRELTQAPGVVTVTVAVPEAWLALATTELAAARLPCAWLATIGGPSRTASTRLALEALRTSRPLGDDDLVAVHDAARPFATRHLLARVARAAAAHGAAVPGVAVGDTVVQLAGEADEDAQVRYLERDSLRALQTPQVFRWRPLQAAHEWCRERGREFTDDGGLLAARGLPPVVVMGEPDNWKVTTDADLARAEELLRRRAALT